MNSSIRKYIISFLFFTIVQVVIFQNFNLSEWGFAFVYIAFVLFLPIDMPIILLLLLAFFQGIIMDIFYNTLGLHAFVIVLIAYLRSYFIKLFAPKMMDNLDNVDNVGQFGIQRVMIYTLSLVFIHHLFLFFMMAGDANLFFHTLLKVIISTFVSTVVIMFFRKLFFDNL